MKMQNATKTDSPNWTFSFTTQQPLRIMEPLLHFSNRYTWAYLVKKPPSVYGRDEGSYGEKCNFVTVWFSVLSFSFEKALVR